MSSISNIHDNLYTLVAATLTNHAELRRPTNIELNSDLFLKKGFGISVSSAVRGTRNISCRYWLQRDFIITNTLAIYGTDTSNTIRKIAEKTLLENQKLLITALETDNTLSGYCNNLRFVNDAGIEFIHVDEKDYIMLQSTFTLEYSETFN